MKLYKYSLVFFILLLLSVNGCNLFQSKTDYITDYEYWVQNLKVKYNDYTPDEWQKAESQFINYSETRYLYFKESLTDEEVRKLNLLSGQFYGIKAKYKINQIKHGVINVLEKIEGAYNEIGNNTY
jgi:hypothetical protein